MTRELLSDITGGQARTEDAPKSSHFIYSSNPINNKLPPNSSATESTKLKQKEILFCGEIIKNKNEISLKRNEDVKWVREKRWNRFKCVLCLKPSLPHLSLPLCSFFLFPFHISFATSKYILALSRVDGREKENFFWLQITPISFPPQSAVYSARNYSLLPFNYDHSTHIKHFR